MRRRRVQARWPAALGIGLALTVPVACSSADGGSLEGLGLPDTTPFRTTLIEVITTTTAPPPTEPPMSVGPVESVPAADRPGTYTVQAGDAWYLIANRLGVDVEDLLAANGATVETALFPGKVLAVPGASAPGQSVPATSAVPQSSAPPGSSAGGTYTVVDGDYWLGIAQKLGVELQELLDANGATTETAIFPGDVIAVP
jgi:LysM repeat protein